jgi:phosphatidate cytidylyltransferase
MRELATRSAVGVLLMIVALAGSMRGGWPFALSVALVATIMYIEWTRIVAQWGWIWRAIGFVYCLVPAVALLWIREAAEPLGIGRSFDLLIYVFIVTWSTDIGAYFAGRAIGGPKLAPGISPNKTVAGLIGGMASAAALGWVWADITNLPALLIWLGAPLGFAAQMGDLFESGLKRKAGVKDSGTWLPGHGGLLDRLDGMVPVAVIVALLMVVGAL